MSNKKKSAIPGFTVGLAAVDFIPVISFGAGMALIYGMFDSALFAVGACVCVLAGLGKCLWKLLIAACGWEFPILNRQLRYLMPTGFALMLLSVILRWKSIAWAAVASSVLSFPAVLFFALGVIGLAALSVLGKRLNQRSAGSNWLEEAVNTLAQLCVLAGIIFICLAQG